MPDRIVILPQMLLFVELKTAKGKLSELQKIQIKRLRRLGQTVYVIRSKKQVDDLIEFYKNMRELGADNKNGTSL